MRAVVLLALLSPSFGCVTEKSTPCYEPDAPNRPDGPHLVFNEDTGTCIRVEGSDAAMKDASVDATPDAEVECTSSAQCTETAKPLCDDNTCVACNEVADAAAACAEKSEATPVCETQAGECVGCELNTDCEDATQSF